MPSISINNGVINTFAFNVYFNIFDRTVLFDTSPSCYAGSSGSGIFSIEGISFQLKDQQGVVLAEIDFDNPQIPDPSADPTYTLDLSSLSYAFIFQKYSIVGAIKDSNGNIYQTVTAYPKVCQPVDFYDGGYVPGIFQIIPNCIDNVLTVKELTLLVYNNKTPDSYTKDGTLYYPTGTIASIPFTGTPFSNNNVYTGEYRVTDTTAATYDMGNGIYVIVTYYTDSVFPVTCSNILSELSCCLTQLQNTYIQNCNNAIGKNAQQQTYNILLPLMQGMVKQMSGQDASTEVAYIKKQLNCDCGSKIIRQNEFTPINASVTSIVLQGAGGTTIPAPTTIGNTKTYQIASNVYIVAKGDTNDLAYKIEVDTSVTNRVVYKLTFNYNVMAGYILTAISNDAQLIAQINSLITSSSGGAVDLSGLNGKCIIDLTQVNFFLTQNVTGATQIVAINAGSNIAAPPGLFATNAAAVQSWLNGLGLGAFTVSYSSGVFSVLSLANTNPRLSLQFSLPDVTVPFQSTNATIVTVLQAIIDYICGLNASQILLGQILSTYQLDYNGQIIISSLTAADSQAAYNYALQQSLSNIVAYINTLTGLTCDKIAALFSDSPNTVFGASSRLYGNDAGSCIAWTSKQIALAVIAAINGYSEVKEQFCAIDCETPGGCPEVAGINMAIVSGNIGIYGLTWNLNPLASQTVTVQHKLSSSSTWLTDSSAIIILPNGNINGTSPFQITGLTAGQTYDVKLVNNCGGVGFVSQITVPTGTAYPGQYVYDNIIYNICGNVASTLYSSAPFGIGVIMYTNLALSIPLTGYTFIADNTGDIYTIDSATGEVLTNTGTSCNFGSPYQVILGNSSGTICAGTAVTRYLNGISGFFGQVLYIDSALTTPVTGYTFMVFIPNNNIYHLNSITGTIGISGGLSCSVYTHSVQPGINEGAACGAGAISAYSSSYFGPGTILYTDAGLTTPLTGYNFVIDAVTGLGYTIDSVTGTIGAETGNSCF